MKRAIRLLAIAFFVLLGVNSSQSQWSQDTLPYGGAVHSFAVSGTNLFVGTDTGGVFLSTDDGAHWISADSGFATNAVNALAVSGTNLFAAVFGVGIFRSSDNGNTWTGVFTGMDAFDYSIGISGTNILVGAENGIIGLSTDNGNDWTSVTTGVTSSNITSFVVSNDSLFAASFGEGIIRSTDGQYVDAVQFRFDGLHGDLFSQGRDGSFCRDLWRYLHFHRQWHQLERRKYRTYNQLFIIFCSRWHKPFRRGVHRRQQRFRIERLWHHLVRHKWSLAVQRTD